MKQKHKLRMTSAKAIRTLNQWAEQYQSNNHDTIKILFDKSAYLGNGSIKCTDGVPESINIGLFPLSLSFPEKYYPITDHDFVLMGVTMFHEFGHYEHFVVDDMSKEIQISDLSKCHNKVYYNVEHHKLPHEIDAEYTGVMTMWSVLESEWPDIANELMFDYLDYRTAKSEHTRKLYMIERPEDGFQSKQQVKDLFDEAFEKSLTEKRNLPEEFLNYDDDTSRLLATDDGRGVRVEYVPVYLKLLKANTGTDTDRMMASLVTHVHPELQNMYAHLDFEELKPDRVFDMTMPETIDESRSRLGYNDSFVSGVDYVTRLQDEEQEL